MKYLTLCLFVLVIKNSQAGDPEVTQEIAGRCLKNAGDTIECLAGGKENMDSVSEALDECKKGVIDWESEDLKNTEFGGCLKGIYDMYLSNERQELGQLICDYNKKESEEIQECDPSREIANTAFWIGVFNVRVHSDEKCLLDEFCEDEDNKETCKEKYYGDFPAEADPEVQFWYITFHMWRVALRYIIAYEFCEHENNVGECIEYYVGDIKEEEEELEKIEENDEKRSFNRKISFLNRRFFSKKSPSLSSRNLLSGLRSFKDHKALSKISKANKLSALLRRFHK